MTHQYMEIKIKELEKRIKALEQEPCLDMEEIREVMSCDADEETKCKMISNILTAKPHHFEKQEPKTGHWIMPIQDDGMSDSIYYQVRCSKCGFDLDPQTWHMELHQYDADKYCPNCGARMVKPQEGSDKD